MKNELSIRCQDCRFWKTSQPENPSNKWRFGVCTRIQYGIMIMIKPEYQGQESVVDRVETDANFACAYAEKQK